jgi:hypothetical protein
VEIKQVISFAGKIKLFYFRLAFISKSSFDGDSERQVNPQLIEKIVER